MFVENLNFVALLVLPTSLLQQWIVKENCRTMNHGFSSLTTMYFS